jgi:hypothetical protein
MFEVEVQAQERTQRRLGQGLGEIGRGVDEHGHPRQPYIPECDNQVERVARDEAAPEAGEPFARLVHAARDQPAPDERREHRPARGSAQRHQLIPLTLLGAEQLEQHAGTEGSVAAAALARDHDAGDFWCAVAHLSALLNVRLG